MVVGRSVGRGGGGGGAPKRGLPANLVKKVGVGGIFIVVVVIS
jgi:hypothetical protein